MLAGVFILLVGPPKSGNLKGRVGEMNSTVPLLFNFTLLFTFLFFSSFAFPNFVRSSPMCCHLLGGIAYLDDPDSYGVWTFYTPVRVTQARQAEG